MNTLFLPTRFRGLLAWACLAAFCAAVPNALKAESGPVASAQPSPTFCDVAKTRIALRELCEYVAVEKARMPTIFIGAYYMRTLVAGSQLLGEPRYLDVAFAYADWLLTQQQENGFWQTGYRDIYLADTGSALGLFMVLYRHADEGRRASYLLAVRRYLESIQREGMIHPSGAFGVGYRARKNGTVMEPWNDEYTISSALSGGAVSIWMYQKTGDARYLEIAHNALNWILSTQGKDGAIPYVLKGDGSDYGKKGDPTVDFLLWEKNRFQAITYFGEGVIAFDRYSGKPEWRKELRAKVQPTIEFILRTQNADGTWGAGDAVHSYDQKRSPGVSNFLVWYYVNVRQDERVLSAVRRFNAFLLDREAQRPFGLLHAGGDASNPAKLGKYTQNDVLTALTGRALGDMLQPGIDAAW